MLQTVLASSKLRNIGRNRMQERAVEQIVDAGEGVRLLGLSSEVENGSPKGGIILLHGWEGSAKSAYIVSLGRFLFRSGFHVSRLNLRDHGDSHHLNEGLFFGTLLRESFTAVKAIADQWPDLPVFIAGFSMGGNFAIRIAKYCDRIPIPNLCGVLCINPPLNPLESTRRIDEFPLIRRYFVKKWQRSLVKNQELYPGLYDFREVLTMDRCWEMTKRLLADYSDYKGPSDYFGEYTLTSGYLDSIHIPATIITAEDDPIISVDDFRKAKAASGVDILIQPFGGHCGYIEGFGLSAWYQKILLRRITKMAL